MIKTLRVHRDGDLELNVQTTASQSGGGSSVLSLLGQAQSCEWRAFMGSEQRSVLETEGASFHLDARAGGLSSGITGNQGWEGASPKTTGKSGIVRGEIVESSLCARLCPVSDQEMSTVEISWSLWTPLWRKCPLTPSRLWLHTCNQGL